MVRGPQFEKRCLKDTRGYSYLKEESLDRTMRRAGFGRGFGLVVRQTAKWMDECRGFSSFQNIQMDCSPEGGHDWPKHVVKLLILFCFIFY